MRLIFCVVNGKLNAKWRGILRRTTASKFNFTADVEDWVKAPHRISNTTVIPILHMAIVVVGCLFKWLRHTINHPIHQENSRSSGNIIDGPKEMHNGDSQWGTWYYFISLLVGLHGDSVKRIEIRIRVNYVSHLSTFTVDGCCQPRNQ